MKRIVVCACCGQPTKYYGSYKVKIHDNWVNPISGEIKEVEREGRICPACNTKIYKGGEADG